MTDWDAHYSEAEFVYGTAPNDFLAAEWRRLPPGRVLCLAEGQGRNAVFLAQQGYEVVAVDQSAVGLQKAQQLAAQRGVRIETVVADLADFVIEPAAWQGIVSIFAHVPRAVREAVHARVPAGLCPGGVFLLEAYTPRQWEIGGTGGPKDKDSELFMMLPALRRELAGLEFLLAQETEREVNEGGFHRGRAAVVQLLARRPQ